MWPIHEHTDENEVLQARFLLIAIGVSLVFDRSSDVSGRGHPTHRNLSGKLHNDGDHDTTPGVLLPSESQSQYRDAIQYKTVRGRASEISTPSFSSLFNSLYSLTSPLKHFTFINLHHVDVFWKAFHHHQCCPRRHSQRLPR